MGGMTYSLWVLAISMLIMPLANAGLDRILAFQRRNLERGRLRREREKLGPQLLDGGTLYGERSPADGPATPPREPTKLLPRP